MSIHRDDMAKKSIERQYWNGKKEEPLRFEGERFEQMLYANCIWNTAVFEDCEFVRCEFKHSELGLNVVYRNCRWERCKIWGSSGGMGGGWGYDGPPSRYVFQLQLLQNEYPRN